MLLAITALGFAAHFEAQAQTPHVVTLYEGDRENGASRKYFAGNWYLGGAEDFDNRASSMTVADGMSVAVCDASMNPAYITGGRTPDRCLRFPEGEYRFQGFDKKATYIVVENFEIHRHDCIVCLYSDTVSRGYVTRYNATGTFSLGEPLGGSAKIDGNDAPTIGGSTNSLWVAPGYAVTVKAEDISKTYGSEAHNLPPDLINHITEIIIKKSYFGLDSPRKVPNAKLLKVKPRLILKRKP